MERKRQVAASPSMELMAKWREEAHLGVLGGRCPPSSPHLSLLSLLWHLAHLEKGMERGETPAIPLGMPRGHQECLGDTRNALGSSTYPACPALPAAPLCRSVPAAPGSRGVLAGQAARPSQGDQVCPGMPPSPPGSASGKCNTPSALRGQVGRSAPAAMWRCQGAISSHPPCPVTIKHLAQLLQDEPLDLIIINHVSLGETGGDVTTGGCGGTGTPSHPSLPSSLGVLAARGCPQVPVSQGGPSLLRAPVAPRGPWSRFSPAPPACQLCPSPQGSPALQGIQLRPVERWRVRAEPQQPKQGWGTLGWPRGHNQALPSPSGQRVLQYRVFLGDPGETQRSGVAGMSPTWAPWGRCGQAR